MENNDEPLDIVLAEDDIDDVTIFETALKDTGINYELRNAADGELLFVLLEANVPYILFLDIEMPRKDGIACIQEIRKDSRYDGMPVIIYTSHLKDAYINDSYRSGANLFLTKRENYSDIVNDLKNIFETNWSKNLLYPAMKDYIIK